MNCNTEKVRRQYGEAKHQNMLLYRSLRRLGDKRWSLVANCSQALGIKYCPSCGRTHADVSWCCRHRLCPICAMRRSRKIGRQALDAFEALRQRGELENTKLYLLTLTQKNVEPVHLADEIDGLLAALKSIRHTRDVRRFVIGAARNIEVTYNSRSRTFHPHVHMIVILSGDASEELSTSAYWRSVWRRVMKLDYEPICDIRPIVDAQGAVCEVSKYCIKPSSIYGLQLSDDELDMVVSTLNTSLAGRRLVSYTGIWRAIRADLKQKEPDDDLEHDDTSDVCGCGAALMDAILKWDGLEYRAITLADVL